MRIILYTLLLLSILLLAACGEESVDQNKSDASTNARLDEPATVVAEDRLGIIDLQDIDNFILGLTPSKRWQSGIKPADWYRGIVERIAVDRLLLDEAQLLAADQEADFLSRERSILRNPYSSTYLQQAEKSAVMISDEDLSSYYEENRQSYEFPESRRLHHIFKSVDADADSQAVRAELQQLRNKVLAGENFMLLARAHSDSETRHQDGVLGVIEPGQFSDDFDQIVFALELNIPSEVVQTKDGFHLFFVNEILPAQEYAFEEVRGLIFRELMANRVLEWLEAAAAELPQPELTRIPTKQQLGLLLKQGNLPSVLMAIGDYRMSVGEFIEVMTDLRRQIGGRHEADLAFKTIRELAAREIIYQHLLNQGLPEIDDKALQAERDRQLTDYFVQRKLVAYLSAHPQRIARHYENNKMRFSSPVKVHLQRLMVPKSVEDEGTPLVEVMARLEAARADLDAGTLQIAPLAEELGGKLEDLGTVTSNKLRRIDQQAIRFAFLLEAGDHSPPYTTDKAFYILKVVSRQEAKALPLSVTREKVMDDYLTHYSARVYRELTEQMLLESGFKINEQNLMRISPLTPAS